MIIRYKNLLAIIVSLFLSACFDGQTQLQQVQKNGELRVLSRMNPDSYFPSGEISRAFEQELTGKFAEFLGVKPVFRLIHPQSTIPELFADESDMASGYLVQASSDKLIFSRAYQTVSPVIVYNREQQFLNRKELLQSGQLVIPLGQEMNLLQDLLSDDLSMPPSLEIDENRDSEELLKAVANGDLPATITTSNKFLRMRNYYPQLSSYKNSRQHELQLAFAFKKKSDHSLLIESNLFLSRLEASGELQRLIQRHYGQTEQFSYWDNLAFISRIDERLPTYQDLFIKTAEEHNLDWRFLAAIGYQESHWDEKASSFTGVKGLMMLTEAAASELGIEDRTDPVQSIDGGARYFLKLKRKFADRIKEPDRSWFALAAYNVGYGHLEDARVLAQSEGKNPDIWYEVETYLPRLSEKQWYEKTRYGRARGEEPVQFVRNIRRYYDTLVWFDEQKNDRRYVRRQLNQLFIDLPTL